MSAKDELIDEIKELISFYEKEIIEDSMQLNVNTRKSLYYKLADMSIRQFKGVISNLNKLIQKIESK